VRVLSRSGQAAVKNGTFYNGCALSYNAICLNQTAAYAYCQARGGDLASYINTAGLVGLSARLVLQAAPQEAPTARPVCKCCSLAGRLLAVLRALITS
jgi:hypothetical protein